MDDEIKKIIDEVEYIYKTDEDARFDWSSRKDYCVYSLTLKDSGEIIQYGSVCTKDFSEEGFSGLLRAIDEKRGIDKAVVIDKLRDESARRIVKVLSEKMKEEKGLPLMTRETTELFREGSYSFEKTPIHEASEAEKYYLGREDKPFDIVDKDNLKKVFIYDGFLEKTIMKEVYHNDLYPYYELLLEKLRTIGSSIISSRYAKSCTAWIYLGGSATYMYDEFQEKSMNKNGKNIPTYHLLDVLKELEPVSIEGLDVKISPKNNRIDIEEIRKSKANCKISNDFMQIRKLIAEAVKLEDAKEYEKALSVLDKAREYGQYDFWIYKEYIKIYEELKDDENEIDILQEELYVMQHPWGHQQWKVNGPDFSDRANKLIELKRKWIQVH